ncbi:MAG: GNAT family N-acetyltransferase, partial [Deltaproteobacteria bacterium]|nr:GNAT family N-acetyltransferase [Deltaproteobacteria bacterium]
HNMSDIEPCGRILYKAFKEVFERHHFPPPFSSIEKACQSIRFYFHKPSWSCLVAELEGRVVGSCLVDERDSIRSIGPISVDPQFQMKGVGRRLMEVVLERHSEAEGIRLIQDAFNSSSMSLYTSLGFEVKEPIAGMKGWLKNRPPGKINVRRLRIEDLHACADLCYKLHGIERTNELKDSINDGTAFGVDRNGRITAYVSSLSRQGHGLAENEKDLEAILLFICSKYRRAISILVPTRQTGFFNWCLNQGLRVIDPLNLMAMGKYQEPKGCFYISVRY